MLPSKLVLCGACEVGPLQSHLLLQPAVENCPTGSVTSLISERWLCFELVLVSERHSSCQGLKSISCHLSTRESRSAKRSAAQRAHVRMAERSASERQPAPCQARGGKQRSPQTARAKDLVLDVYSLRDHASKNQGLVQVP